MFLPGLKMKLVYLHGSKTYLTLFFWHLTLFLTILRTSIC